MRTIMLLVMLGFAIAFTLSLLSGCGGGGDFPESTTLPVNCGQGACK